MKISLPVIIITGILALAAVMTYPFYAGANSLEILNSSGTTCRSAAATSTTNYMTPGTATTTVSCDLFALAGGSQDRVPNKFFVRIFQTASSTNSTQTARFEWSDDNITWYADSALTTTDVASSTFMVSNYKEYSWPYASTTPQAGVVPATANTGARTFEVPVRARYVRGMFYIPAGATNSGIWAGFTGIREERSVR